ncbi:MFS transporter [Agromyces sp. CFH 90414]|uniref:MFS transporter n=1 Tax=Agromyces agglutinans TaxID=2662258 RepID=A0A6I2FK80_9MICO|nr:MFS transporter [Agromyces agglutinans]MRG61078.1 MFS transporter [Agromyces agglutinans]
MSITEPRRERATEMPWAALIALASAVFLSITIELLPTGLLPEMGEGLAVPEALIGLTVSVFAFTVVLTSTTLVAATSRIPRRGLIVTVLVVLGVSTALSALAMEYWMLIAARVFGGLAHGVFWAIVAATASRLVPERHIGRAIAVVLGGGTLAMIAGVPATTVLGQAFGWRVAFGAVAALTLAGAVAVRLLLPRAEPGAEPTIARYRPRDPGFATVVLLCVVTAVTMLGQYAVTTYVAPLVTDVIGLPASAVGPLLFVSGLAGAAGLIAAGSPIARNATAAMRTALLVAAGALTVIGLAISPVVSVVAFAVWGLAFGAIPPLLQTRLLRTAPAAYRDAASALYTTAFNVGIGGGALVGSVVFGTLGVAALPWGYAVVLVVAALLVVLGATRAAARPRPLPLP